MSEAKITELTEKHEAALERLEAYELAQKGARKWLFTAVLTALGTAGGGGGLAYFDSASDDKVESALTYIVEEQAEDVEHLQDQVGALRDAVFRLQVTLDGMANRHRDSGQIRERLHEVEELLEDVGKKRTRRKPLLLE